MKKELQISAKFDTSDFDKSVESMQKKLKDIYAPQDALRMQQQTAQRLQSMGMGGNMSAPANGAYAQATQQGRRELEQSIRGEARIQEQLGKEIVKRAETLKKLRETQKSLVADSKEELAIKEKIARVAETAARQQETYKQRDAVLNQMMDARERGQGAGTGAGLGAAGGGNKGGGFSAGGAQSILKNVGGTLGMIAAIAAAGTAAVDQYASIPLQRNTALASQTQTLVGGHLQNIASGNVVNEMGFASERQRAAQMATEKLATTQKTDAVNGVLGIKGIASLLGIGDSRNGDLMMSNVSGALGFKKASEQYSSNYQAKLMQGYGQDYQQQSEAEMQKNPLKNLAVDRLQNRYQGDLGSQRMMGLNDQQFYGPHGFQESANKGGFTEDLAAQMARSIQGAGGSTRGMQGSSLLGLQAQRGMDLTNSGAVLGRISGGAGSSGATDAVFKKLMEEAVKSGLDKSEYREEQRKFADITSEILGKTGAKTGEDAQQILQGFSRFLGKDSTMKELEGAKSAYQEQQGFSAETGGRGGALQFAGLMQQPGMSKLGAKGIAGLMEMPEQDLTSTNPYIIAEASKSGKTPEDLIAQVMTAKRQKALIEVGISPKKMKSLNDYMTKKGLDEGSITQEQIRGMPEDVRQSYYQEMEASTVRSGYEGTQKRTSVARGLRTGTSESPGGQFGPATSVEAQLQASTGRAGDDVTRSAGVAAQAMLENFRDFKKEITPASDALDAFTKKIILLAGVMNMTPDKDRAAVSKFAGDELGKTVKGQQNASKPSGK